MGPPQDEAKFLIILRKSLILRRPRSGRLEGHHTAITASEPKAEHRVAASANLSVELDRGVAAIDEQIAPGNKTRSLACEKHRCRRDLLGAAEPAQQMF